VSSRSITRRQNPGDSEQNIFGGEGARTVWLKTSGTWAAFASDASLRNSRRVFVECNQIQRAIFCVLLFLNFAQCSGQAWAETATDRRRPLAIPRAGHAGFTLLPGEQTGILFTNVLAAQRHFTNSMLLNGSGVAAGDIDGDGLCDIYACGLDSPNALYKNLGNWKFTNIAAQAGVKLPNLDCTGGAFVDLDGDGDLDLLVNTFTAGTFIFINDGKGHFSELPIPRPNTEKAGMSLGIGDLDGDGWLDVYIANYRRTALLDMGQTHFTFKTVNGRKMIDRVNGVPATNPELTNRFVVTPTGGIEEVGEPDLVLRNLHGTNLVSIPFNSGAFLDESGAPLKEPLYDWGLSVMVRDINQDGMPDIYVCNDFDSPDRIWLNQGHGKFQAAPRLALRKTSFFSMGIDFADINRDGLDDFILLDMASRNRINAMTTQPPRQSPNLQIGDLFERAEYMMNCLEVNRGDGTYAEIGQLAGIWATEWSWSAIFLDVDLDGFEDLLVTNGYERDARNLDIQAQLRAARAGKQVSRAEQMAMRRFFPRLNTRNIAFRNNGRFRFEDKSAAWGFDLPEISNGMCLADLDNDGDLDVIVNNMNAPLAVYRNETAAPRIAVTLNGKAPNTRGIGARVTVKGGPVPQSQEMIAGGRYLSSDQPIRTFAAGEHPLEIEVLWPDKTRTVVTNAQTNMLYEIKQTSTRLVSTASPTQLKPWFEEVSGLLNHAHSEIPFDDFARQPLLSKKLSQQGPGIAFADLDGDGRDDLVISSGVGGKLAVYRNLTNKFEVWKNPLWDISAARDQLTVLPFLANGSTSLLVSLSNYEDGLPGGPGVHNYNLTAKSAENIFEAQPSSFGAMTLGDIDGDGTLELFVAGRVLPGKYPRPCSSFILRQHDGKWSIDPTNSAPFKDLGMITSAVFADLNGDGRADLLAASEWGPVHLFLSENGALREHTSDFGLNSFLGLWNGVGVGDFDNDGQLDFVAGNWGENEAYLPSEGHPLKNFFGSFSGGATTEVVESHYDSVLQKEVPDRGFDAVARAIPSLKERFPTYTGYAKAGINELIGTTSASVLQANWLATTVFLNRGNHFEAKPLPVEAQFAPAFGVSVADFDGDGNFDIFLAQNFFAVAKDIPRWDAGVGLVLRGMGNGTFQPLAVNQSGIRIYGEARGSAVSDWDNDGRIDLAVGQNGSPTKLFKNKIATAGVRVRLRGSSGNPEAIGAVIRPMAGQTPEAARAVTKGTGWLSSDSAIQIVQPTARAIDVRWPGGKSTETAVTAGSRELEIVAPK
jgi:hypothetical protein